MWRLLNCLILFSLISLSVSMRRQSRSPKRKYGSMSQTVQSSDRFVHERFELSDSSQPPPCISNETELAYVGGMLSASQTFYNCINNVADPGMISTFYNGKYNGQLRINTSITLNNLEFINEIEGTARLQFSIRLYWQDDRFAMPLFWNMSGLQSQPLGIDITTLLLNDSILLWTPELRFPDAADINIMVSYLRFNSSNIFEWGAAVDTTLLQPKFNFRSYPSDTQTVNIRYIVFNFPTPFCVLGFYGGQSLKFNENFDGSYTFEDNPVWEYKSTTYSNFEGNGFTYALYQITVERQGDGIVLRLVLPITLLLVLAGLTFWVTFENRVDTTITLLLSISALYIVILTNIPLVGYLTDVDKYVFWMFLLLVCVVILHQMYATLEKKLDSWPLRPVYMRSIETIGRIVLIPFILFYFVAEIEGNEASTMNSLLIGAAVIFLITISGRELAGLRSTYKKSIEKLVAKFNSKETSLSDISWLEVAVINALIFRKFSLSTNWIAQHFSRHDQIVYDISQGQRIKDLNTISASSEAQRKAEDGIRNSVSRVDVTQRQSTASFSHDPLMVDPGVQLNVIPSPLHRESSFRNSTTSSMQQSIDSDDEA